MSPSRAAQVRQFKLRTLHMWSQRWQISRLPRGTPRRAQCRCRSGICAQTMRGTGPSGAPGSEDDP
eukprot:1416425-Alexandrium_andersonii.AAC.1